MIMTTLISALTSGVGLMLMATPRIVHYVQTQGLDAQLVGNALREAYVPPQHIPEDISHLMQSIH